MKPWEQIEVKRPKASSRMARSASSPTLIHEIFLKGSMPMRWKMRWTEASPRLPGANSPSAV
ncbi:hypothetical protein D3C86_2097610 [compost metagenome]